MLRYRSAKFVVCVGKFRIDPDRLSEHFLGLLTVPPGLGLLALLERLASRWGHLVVQLPYRNTWILHETDLVYELNKLSFAII